MNKITLDITIRRMQEVQNEHQKRAVSHKWKSGRNMVHMKKETNLLRKLGYGIKTLYHKYEANGHIAKSRLEPLRCYVCD